MIAGIDLGTTGSTIAVIAGEGGNPMIVPNSEGEKRTPSVVAFDPRMDEWCVGAAARRQAVTNAGGSVLNVKRLIGRKFTDSIVRGGGSRMRYEGAPSNSTDIELIVAGGKHSPEKIVATILRKLKEDAENYIGEKISEAVIAVPSCFSGNQRRAIREAADVARIKVLRTISEASAAYNGILDEKKRRRDDRSISPGRGRF